MRQKFEWDLGKRRLALGERTLVMGVVNVTPDSFSDGGLHLDPKHAVAHALRLLDEGADIVDVGGESTRPGAGVRPSAGGQYFARHHVPVPEEDELRRVIPVVEAVKRARPDAVVSVDTYKAPVASAAVAAGAEIVNDVSGFLWDAAMATTLRGLTCGAVLMHMRGRPEEWRTLPPIGDALGLVKRELRDRTGKALEAGVAGERLVLDPGFGFGKNFEENYPLLGRFGELQELGFPLLAGVSRKSFLGRTVARHGKDAPTAERLAGTLAAETTLVMSGVHILRTHDVRACVDAVRVAEAILRAQG
jgi:dihydropteroate synthase